MKFIFGQAKRKNEFYLAIKGRIQPDTYIKKQPSSGKRKGKPDVLKAEALVGNYSCNSCQPRNN